MLERRKLQIQHVQQRPTEQQQCCIYIYYFNKIYTTILQAFTF
nr:MAG TPA: hypothetical protein [Caudoviricetes sp.]